MEFSTPVLDTPDKATPKVAVPRPHLRPERELSGEVRPTPRVSLITRLRSNKPAYASAVLLAIIILSAIAAPLLSPHAVDEINSGAKLLSPSLSHPFGTDDMGRDLFVRVIKGARISVALGVTSVIFALLIGVIGGGIAGYYGGLVEAIIMRFADVMMSIPVFLIVLLCASIFSPGFILLCVLIGSVQWMEVARVVRSVVLSTKENEFVEAAHALGVPDSRILFRHIFPHTVGPVLVAASLGLAQAIMIESTLSFLGFGLEPPSVTWGALLRNAQGYLGSAPWIAVFPGIMIFMTVLCCYVLGDFLKSVADPRRNTPRSSAGAV
jgi:peptide/nickel transport system permease protein